MKMHLYKLHPSIWEVVVVGVTSPKNGIPMAEQAQDYFRNTQAVRVITGSLRAQEFNKVRSVEIAKGTDQVKEGKMNFIHGELEYFIMFEEEIVRQMFDRLMLLVPDIRSLGSTDWDDHKVTKKMLRDFTPRNPTLATMIRRYPSFKAKTPNQLLSEILHQELVERDVAKSLSVRMKKSVSLNVSSSAMIESSPKALKSKKEDSSEEGSTNEETAFAIRNCKKFLKKAFKKNGDDRKKTSQKRCYECKEVGYFIADCPYKKKKEMEEKRLKEKNKDYSKKYQGSNKECMEILAICKPTTSTRFFNNTSDNQDDTPFCLMAKGTKVPDTTSSSSISSFISSNMQNELDDEEEKLNDNIIKEFGNKRYKEIKKLSKKLEKKKESLNRQEDLLILEKERNLALEKALAEQKAKGEKLAIDLSLANDSHERMLKELTLANESLTSLKTTHSELQENFSCLTVKFKDLEANLDSNASTSEGCSRCYKIDVNACVANIAMLEDSIKARDVQIKRLNMLVTQGYEGKAKPEPKIKYKDGRHPRYMDGLGHYKRSKVNEWKVVNGKEVLKFNKGANLGDLMDMAHGIVKTNTTQVKSTANATTKVNVMEISMTKSKDKVVEHEASSSYTTDYMVTMDHNGKIVVKYIGAYTKKAIFRSVWVPKIYPSNQQGPKSFWVPKF
ncbi:hypothetical protein SETIT_2G112800v2 [Setaria italica]|uniref:CCHC-type domain-containing protein n=1 Tax=Setaria italica TaxID=4555 RepID=A0A368PXT1_SETIT|nr:hypothetical protein SETIT_2G112800v2 [Setaria italica]